MLLVTGSDGLIGTPLVDHLRNAGHDVRRFDLKRSPVEDICDPESLRRAVDGVTGVVHLAAMTRVVPAQNDPVLCRRTNTEAVETLVRACFDSPARPWLISASSREVYGQADRLPVSEDAPMRPMNTYARSKVRGEEIVDAARANGLRTNICRFSNVYGAVNDHDDRVVNAFARAAAFGGGIRVEGPGNTFDFTFISEVAEGLAELVFATDAGEVLPPIHFASGSGTTLQELAEVASRHAKAPVSVAEAPPRSFDVSHFIGDPARARSLLGWQARIGIDDGFRRLRDLHRSARRAVAGTEPA